ncbi:sodium channel protein Nach isoform X2 [Cephus cinctus]|uniref:Sodium channel protein Nach isoform X2 n=1 Tax=Cephus cinctus TaxID=211228 RepID=A0AAJ7FU10_CEPCN|nr:sodium channel protein Nach isoform X2 [Cephus cinctus]
MLRKNKIIRKREEFGHSLGWATPKKDKNLIKNQCTNVLLKHIKIYLHNCSLVGCKYLAEPRRPWTERIFWIIVHVISIYLLGHTVYTIYGQYLQSPIVTTLDTHYYPSYNLQFPGVAVCSINRISREAATRLARNIFVANKSKIKEETILDMIWSLGDVYSTVYDVASEPVDIDKLLRKYYGGPYDMSSIMKDLTPRCEDIFVSCKFDSRSQDCSEIFDFLETQDGFCCTFNYIRNRNYKRSSEANKPDKIHHINSLGAAGGLSVILKPLLRDYFFPILPLQGWKVTIFNPNDYPDNTSGGVTDVLISPLMEAFLQMDAIFFHSTDGIRNFPIRKRKCVFDDETDVYRGYTYSDCIVNCRVKDIWKTCGCRPFFYPESTIKGTSRICDMTDIECLHKNKAKWWSPLPNELKAGANITESFVCDECYPTCNDVRYQVSTSCLQLKTGLYHVADRFNFTVEDESIVHVYFTKYGTLKLKQDLAYYWYELLSNIGGICGVFIGFSLISVPEIIYFLILPLLNCRGRAPNGHRMNPAKNEPATVHALYWNELQPRSQNRKGRRRRVGQRRGIRRIRQIHR